MSTKDEVAVRPRTLRVRNPATGEELASYDEFGPEDVEAALVEADAAQQRWRDVPLEDRAPHVRALGAALREDREALARLISTEMGKPLVEAQAEIDKCALNCDFYAGAAGDFLAERHIDTAAEDSYVAHEPLGVVLAIMPWNFPFWQMLRFLAPALMRAFVAAAEALAIGDPLADGTALGPMARADLLDALERQVDASVSAGATVLTGGRRLGGPGTFFPPTVLSGVTPDMTVFREETFGPVAAVIRARDEDEAVELANDTVFGLAASVWTSDPERGTRVGCRIRSGALFVNAVVASDPRLPFGGTKRSGYGRELAAQGLLEFINVRTIFVGPAAGTAPARPPAE